jgi:hypothetical protein
MATRRLSALTSVADSTAMDPKPIPFRTDAELCFLECDPAQIEPALVINPRASLHAIAAAALERASRLDDSLRAWECEPTESNISATEFASCHRALAQEVEILLRHLRDALLPPRQEELPGNREPE